MKHKGYTGTAQYSEVDEIFHGKIVGINDSVIYHGTSVAEIKQNFVDAVDGYLAMCEQIGKDPNKPYKGSFNVRMSPERHRQAVIVATQEGITLNKLIDRATTKYIEENQD